MSILDSTFILEAQLVDEREWDEKEMLNIIVVEVDPEDDEAQDAANRFATSVE